MDKEYDIETLVSNIDFNSGSFQNINGMMLTNHEIEVLDRYKIPYKKCNSLKEIIFEIEEIIEDSDIVDEELDYISSTISERDYYQNTNK
jgi:hypothetical protein